MYCGIDVGLKRSIAAVIDKKLVYLGDYRSIPDVKAAGIDAPLSLPKSGYLRECERKLLKMGIKLFPSGAPFFKKIALRGIEIAEELRSRSIEVFEVYPYATRVILNIAPKANKRTKSGCREIEKALSRYIEVKDLNHDELDAVIAALTVKLYYDGKAELIDCEDGAILIPKINIQRD